VIGLPVISQYSSMRDAAFTVDGLAHYGVYQSPCTDHCQELRQQEEELVSMRLRGLALRQDYLKAGFDNGNNEEVCLREVWASSIVSIVIFSLLSLSVKFKLLLV